MEKRLILAVILTLGVILLTNILFPPAPPQTQQETVVPDTAPGAEEAPTPAGPPRPADTLPAGIARPDTALGPEPGEPAAAVREDTIVVRSPLYTLRFSTIGASLLSAEMIHYVDYSPNGPEDRPVELVRGGDRLLGYEIAIGADTIDLRESEFSTPQREIVLSEANPRDSLTVRYAFPNSRLELILTYGFDVSTYQVSVRGGFSAPVERGYTILTSLGNGLRSNEANTREDYGQLAYVVNSRNGGITSHKLEDLAPGVTRAAEGGPFNWVAVKNKYFLIAYIAPDEQPGFGGLLVTGIGEEHAGQMEATMPVPAGAAGFAFRVYAGPQDFGRLASIGQELQNVNPYGWRWMRPLIKPLVGLIMTVLTWFHTTFNLAYGWVLIIFGVLMRVVLFPLYQKSMRAQMAQMRVQPQMKELQAKYKEDPQKLQQEMMRLYKEHNINPLGGCLPMLLPFPILITLFFVFQNTIEFRGVPFLWLPDLSLADPLYIVPILMGLSMFLLSWIGQRGMQQTSQMKIMAYAMPVVFTLLFLNFPSGLNLYYASMNFASLPQQLLIARERRQAQPVPPQAA